MTRTRRTSLRADAPTPENGSHIPVLLEAVVASLAPRHDATYVDGTFGAGGYSRAMLEAGASVIAIDRDPNVRLREVADTVGITERAAQRILADLVEAGYVDRTRVGIVEA